MKCLLCLIWLNHSSVQEFSLSRAMHNTYSTTGTIGAVCDIVCKMPRRGGICDHLQYAVRQLLTCNRIKLDICEVRVRF